MITLLVLDQEGLNIPKEKKHYEFSVGKNALEIYSFSFSEELENCLLGINYS